MITVPSGSLYIPNHGLETGDRVKYSPGDGLALTVRLNTSDAYSIVGTTTARLANNEILWTAKITEDLVGLSTVRVARSSGSRDGFVGVADSCRNSRLLLFDGSNTDTAGLGTGIYHSIRNDLETTAEGITDPGTMSAMSGLNWIATANMSRNKVVVATAATHGLSTGDNVTIKVNPSNTKTVVWLATKRIHQLANRYRGIQKPKQATA